MGVVTPTIERLLYRVTRSPSGCWLWPGAKAGSGYGVISSGKRRIAYVHRVTYEHFVGQIPEGLEIDHLCRVRNCANPEHLEAVTHAENRRRARQDKCKRGHPLSEGRNVAGHGRACRKCGALRAAEYRTRKVAPA